MSEIPNKKRKIEEDTTRTEIEQIYINNKERIRFISKEFQRKDETIGKDFRVLVLDDIELQYAVCFSEECKNATFTKKLIKVSICDQTI